MRITDKTCDRLADIMLAKPVGALRHIVAERHQGAWHAAAALAIRHRDATALAAAIRAAVGGAEEGTWTL